MNTIRKRQATAGPAYRMEVFGNGGKVGTRWASKLVPVKDRPGMGPERERVAAYVVFDGTAHPPTSLDGDGRVVPARVDGYFVFGDPR
jgi:hypothetical protein